MTGARLAIGPAPAGRDSLDGGWWPRSRNLSQEFAELYESFPAECGRILRAVYSPPDWDDAPRRLTVGTRTVKVGNFPGDDTHLILVTTWNRTNYCLLVIPPDFDEAQGAEALLAAATQGNRHSARQLLDAVTNELPVDREGLWTS